MNTILKSTSYYVLLTSIFVSCHNNPKEEPIDNLCQEIKITAFDESLTKSMPPIELKLGDYQISLNSSNDTIVCLELGKHQLRIKDINKDSIYLEREIIVTEFKDLLWISFDEQPSNIDYQRHFAYWKLIDTLTKTEPSNFDSYRKMRLELIKEGQLSDSIISKHQKLYDGILKETLRRDIRPKTNESKPMGFSILYHQNMKI